MKFVKALALAAVPLLLAGSASFAQSVSIDEDSDGPVIMNDDTAVIRADPDANLLDGNSTRDTVRDRDGPAVYGWQGCGTYFYWNGETCVDARAAPTDR